MKGTICGIRIPSRLIFLFKNYGQLQGIYGSCDATTQISGPAPQTQIKNQPQPKRRSGPQQVPQRQLPQ